VAVVAYYAFIWVFGAVPHPETGWLAIPVGLLAGCAFGIPVMAYAASIEDDRGQFALVQRFLFVPMFLFSGTFFPLTNLPEWLWWIGWISPLWHASEVGRSVTYGDLAAEWPGVLGHTGYLLALAVAGYLLARVLFTRRLAR
jgi:lipooligosaccharide transport system permease protein